MKEHLSAAACCHIFDNKKNLVRKKCLKGREFKTKEFSTDSDFPIIPFIRRLSALDMVHIIVVQAYLSRIISAFDTNENSQDNYLFCTN